MDILYRLFVRILVLLLSTSCVNIIDRWDERIYTNLNNKTKVKDLTDRLNRNPENTVIRYQLVNIYLEELFFEDAISQLESIIEIEPQNIKAYRILSLTLIKSPRTDYRTAAAVLEKASSIAPNHYGIHAQLALLLSEVNQFADAKRFCDKALSLSQTKSEAASIYLILAYVEPNKANEHYMKAKELDPTVESVDSSLTSIPTYVGKLPLFLLRRHPPMEKRLRELSRTLDVKR